MFPSISETDFKNAWNSMLLDFPSLQIEFFKIISQFKKISNLFVE